MKTSALRPCIYRDNKLSFLTEALHCEIIENSGLLRKNYKKYIITIKVRAKLGLFSFLPDFTK